MAGTLFGSLLGYQFQKRVADRSERRSAVLAFTGTANEFLRSQHDWWWRKQEDRDGPAHVAARTEAFRLRGLVFQTVHQVHLLVPDDSLYSRAERTTEMIHALHRAADREELRALTADARASLNALVGQASRQVR
ncbi:hypothetical protein ACWC3X_42325 [Streptomyces populi]